MADLVGSGNSDRDVDKWLVALKKGSQLLKYGRKGKPKFYPFRLSLDESTLIWLSSNGERTLKLSSVSRIIPGQRTAVFQRYLRPEKDHLSFSLLYNGGKRSLDLICKDKVEAEVWFSGLKTLISSGQYGRSKIDGWNNGVAYSEDAKEFVSNRLSDQSSGSFPDSSEGRLTSSSFPNSHSFGTSIYSERSDVTDMHSKGASSDGFRVSISSAPSTSSHGSAHDDFDASGDVYVWGEIIGDSYTRLSADRNSTFSSARTDILLPKPLDSNVVLDIYHVACGVKHAALVTRQGEVFTWGEESGGRLGHGVGADIIHPRLVESLSQSHVDFVACGEFHSCAVTAAGELYTWGDGKHNAGLLGHGTDVSHWMPKQVAGPLEGLQVSYVSCGVWHSALITVTGQLFTFGDGTFGALGHGNREVVLYPKEVESLAGLRTTSVSCGVWHTAAVVEVIVAQSSTSSGKLFTWGDGDKYRLGHGDKEPRLKPTCVPSLIDHTFHKLACAHSLTVALTTSGQIFTMGSAVYGQLGNPRVDGKVPSLVEDKLVNESIVEVACGSYHVAVLTLKGEVFTWGKGANGRLGHGDLEDRKTPTLVEALKDRPVKRISCGSNFTAAICQHKWVSGAEQSQCSACRQSFGFTRKRHNCYNCGLVHCHQCSSRKALRAALSPNPGKPYRVCDSCYVKLSNSFEPGGFNSKKGGKPRLSAESKDKFDKFDTSSSKSSISSSIDFSKNLDIKVPKGGKNPYLSAPRSPQASSLPQMRSITLTGGINVNQPVSKTVEAPQIQSTNRPRARSPFSRKPSPPRSTTPTPTMSGLSFSKNIPDSLKKTNDLLNQELLRLRAEVDSLRHRCEQQELELQNSEKKAQEAMALATEETSKSKAAKEVIKSLTAQLKELVERLPHGAFDANAKRSLPLSNGFDSHAAQHPDFSSRNWLRNDATNGPHVDPTSIHQILLDEVPSRRLTKIETFGGSEFTMSQYAASSNQNEDAENMTLQPNGETLMVTTRENFDKQAAMPVQSNDSISRSPNSAANQIEAEWIEQFEPGVYITLVALRDGTRDLKRVRFSRRRFGEQQAEAWWSENRDRVFEKYNFRASDRMS